MMRIRETTTEPVYERPRRRVPSVNRTGRVWSPNTCPEVVLLCGAVTSSWLEYRRDGKDWLHCPDHEILEEVVREATLTDRMEYRRLRWQETTQP